jgi:hypothetical protein
MRPKSQERVWCDEQQITTHQAKKLGGVVKLIQLQRNRPDIFDLMVNMARRKRKKA